MFKKNIEIYLKSISQVFFIENVYSGLLFLVSIGYTSYLSETPILFFSALLGAILPNVFAKYNNYDVNLLNAGLYGFNGVLLAMSVSVFMENNVIMWFIMVVGIILSTIITQTFKHILTDKFDIPGSTGPFVITGWLILFSAFQFSTINVHTGIHPEFINNYQQAGGGSHTIFDYISLFFKNIGQVFFLSSPISGALILFGIIISNKVFAFYAIFGSVLAIITAEILGVDNNILFDGLYGFSPVLTSMALGCVFIKDKFYYSVLGVITTVFIQASLYSITESFGIPTFTSAYVLCMYLFVAAFNKVTKES